MGCDDCAAVRRDAIKECAMIVDKWAMEAQWPLDGNPAAIAEWRNRHDLARSIRALLGDDGSDR